MFSSRLSPQRRFLPRGLNALCRVKKLIENLYCGISCMVEKKKPAVYGPENIIKQLYLASVYLQKPRTALIMVCVLASCVAIF